MDVSFPLRTHYSYPVWRRISASTASAFLVHWTVEEEALGEYDTRLPRKFVGPNFTVPYGKKSTREEEIGAEKEKEERKEEKRKDEDEDEEADVVAEASSIFCLERTNRIRGCGDSPLWFKNSG